MSVIENDLNPSVYIGLKLPLEHGNQGFFGRTQKAIEQTKYNIKKQYQYYMYLFICLFQCEEKLYS